MRKTKLNCNNVNEIREERIANSVYTRSATSCVYVQSSGNPLEISIILVNSLQLLNHLGIPFPYVQKNSQIKRLTAS